jgi:hypothetical protein
MTIANTHAHRARGLLTTLREALFESTPEPSEKVSTAPAHGLSNSVEDSASEAAEAALRQLLDEHLGAGVREFAVQVQALEDILPDAQLRQQAALRVLALKGISTQELLLELERALRALTTQNEAFACKLAQRRALLEQRALAANDACESETASARQAIEQLQGELENARTKLTEASARRDEQLLLCRTESSELGDKQLAFERAFVAVQDEYAALKQRFSTELR